MERKSSRIAHHTITTSAQQTRAAGTTLSRRLNPGDVVLLKGDLGAGKTTFAQGVARGMGIAEFIRSSSFVIVNEYAAPVKKKDAKAVTLYHIDLYRLGNGDIEGIGLEDYLSANGICLIEWAQRLPVSYCPVYWEVTLEWKGEHERAITISRVTQRHNKGSKSENTSD